MADEKKGILYGLLPAVGLVALLAAWWLIGKVTAVLCAAFYVGGWVTHKHRAYVKGAAGLPVFLGLRDVAGKAPRH